MKNSTITINFVFANRDASDLVQLNALLDAMNLSDVHLEIDNGYLATTRLRHTTTVHRRYGIERGRLECELASEGEGLHFKIDSCTAECGTDDDEEAFIEAWRKRHPDQVLRTLIVYGFGDVRAYVLIYHEKL